MSFQFVEIRDLFVEIQHVEKGHRLSFGLSDDRGDLFRASFRENPEADGLTQDCWKSGYHYAKRAARAGLLKVKRCLATNSAS